MGACPGRGRRISSSRAAVGQRPMGRRQWCQGGERREGIYSIQTSPGDWVMFWPRDKARPKPSVIPVAPHGKRHHFGLWE